MGDGGIHEEMSLLKEESKGRYAITEGDHWFAANRKCGARSIHGVGSMRPGVEAKG